MIKRNTLQKNIILEALCRLKNHPSADMVYNEIHREHPTISRATVFRNLQQMSESGEIAKRAMPGGADRFDHINGNHYHIKCVSCDAVMDVDMDYLTDLKDSIRSANGFRVLNHNIVFSGICPNCSN